MLRPDELAEMPLDLISLVTELNDRILEDIADRMIRAGKLTGTAEYELIRLREIGAFDVDVRSYLAEYTNQSQREINAMLRQAAELSVKNDIRISGIKAIPYAQNNYLKQLTSSIAGVTEQRFNNITNTLALLNRSTGVPMTFRQTMINALDRMELSFATGLESYDTVIRRTVKELAQSGLIDRGAYYITETGKTVYRNLNVIVRQTAFDSLKQLTQEQARYNARQMGTDVFQISWHSGHRPSHGWGGLRYSTSGSYGYPTEEELYAANGGGLLSDYGCRHDVTAIDPDAPELYSEEELAQLAAKELETTEWRGKELNRYEQEERKRQYERDIRAIRRDQTISKNIWDNATAATEEDAALKYYALKNANNIKTAEYEAFCKKMGLPTEKNRIYYDGRGRLGGALPKKYAELLEVG